MVPSIRWLAKARLMTDADSRIARLEENVTDLEDWRRACSRLPQTVAELIEWRRLQNGFLKDLRDDVRFLREQHAQLQGAIKMMKWALGLSGGSVAFVVIEKIFS